MRSAHKQHVTAHRRISVWRWGALGFIGLVGLMGCDEDAPTSTSVISSAEVSSGERQPEHEESVESEPTAPDEEAPQSQSWTPPENPRVLTAPEPPAIMRDVHLVNDDHEFTQPYVPGHRTTMDGRIGVRVQGGFPGTERIATNYSFFLLVPEGLEEPIMPGPRGAKILQESEPFDVLFPLALEPGINRFGHHSICDPTQAFETEGERPNPYLCGPDLNHDCYDITLVSATASALTAQLWGTPITLEVANPKTVDARIIRADLGEPVRGPEIHATNELLEPAITRDGKLLTARLGRAPRHWVNPNTGEAKYGFYDLVYFPPPEGMRPCDVTAWTEWQPMSHAPYDDRMIGRYGLASYPFRDSEGQLIPDGDDLGGTYPWVDREGANVFMAGIPGRMVEQSEVDYPRVCAHEGCEDYEENIDWDRGFLVAGAWTHGKFVLLDSMINHLDWAIGIIPESHYVVDLYTAPNGDPVPVRLGSGRFITSARDRGGPYPAGYTHNANILDSVQNLLNQHPHAQPVTPRDVVWIMSNGVATDEVVFDDFLDPQALILSNMQASVTQFYSETGEALSVPKYWNGQVRRLAAPIPLPSANQLVADELEEIHIQNGATSLTLDVPPYGRVEAGEGRIEPAALGGMKGKGFWLNGHNQIVYDMPAQRSEFTPSGWYYSLFIDPRNLGDERRVLLTFPDESVIELKGRTTLRYVQRAHETSSGARVVHEVNLPQITASETGWIHLAWRIDPTSSRVETLHNGYPIDRFTPQAPLFRIREGQLILGARGPKGAGFRGWIDDFKVLAHDVDAEVACNHAFGTLIYLEDQPVWSVHAERYPRWAHAELAETLTEPLRLTIAPHPESALFACYHNYQRDYAAHLKNLPQGVHGVRDTLLFPEGPVRADVPRPDSSQNAFCLSCHHEAGKNGLGLDALTYQSELTAEMDPRRQPHQPPRRVFGNIPARWIEGSPDAALQAPVEGFLIDRWLMSADDE